VDSVRIAGKKSPLRCEQHYKLKAQLLSEVDTGIEISNFLSSLEKSLLLCLVENCSIFLFADLKFNDEEQTRNETCNE
jgi:hypothetical protein